MSDHLEVQHFWARKLPGTSPIVAIIVPSIWAMLYVVLWKWSPLTLFLFESLPVFIPFHFIGVVAHAVGTWLRFERMLHYRKRVGDLFHSVNSADSCCSCLVWSLLPCHSSQSARRIIFLTLQCLSFKFFVLTGRAWRGLICSQVISEYTS